MVSSNIRTEKLDKRKRIFNYIYDNKIATRPELASSLSISLPTANQYVQDLLDEELVEEIGSVESGVGRRPVALRCNPRSCLSIGISLTPNHIYGVIVDLFGDAIKSERISAVFEDSKEYRDLIAQMVDNLASAVQTKKIIGVMISVPGVVSTDQNTLSFSHVFPIGLTCEKLTKDIPYKCAFCNDANAAGFAEIWSSSVRHDAVYLSLNETVGGAIIMNGEIYPGSNNRSGEFGHISIMRDGPRCQCGKRGCITCYCSSNELTRNYSNNLDYFFSAYENGEKTAVADFEEYLDYLALGIDTIRSMFDSDIIIGGDVGEHMEPYIHILRQKVYEHNSFSDDSVFVYTCDHKHMASAVGAARLLISEQVKRLAVMSYI